MIYVANYCLFTWTILLWSPFLQAQSAAVSDQVAPSAPPVAAVQVNRREFPKNALRGRMVFGQPPLLAIDGKAERLSPGSRIRGPQGGFVMSGALIGLDVMVNYTREPHGLIHDVWILTEAEAKVKLPGMPRENNFSFQSDVDATPIDLTKTPYKDLPRFK